MTEPQITVSILSWLLEDRLIKTLIQIPKTTSTPLNLCLHVQGSEQISDSKRQEILDAASGFVEKDIFFTRRNMGAAGPRADLLKRSARTPYVFVTDNDMVFREGSIDRLYKFLSDEENSSYGIVDLVNNSLRYHRTVSGTKVTCIPVNFDTQKVVDVDLVGAASLLMRSEVALTPNIIDTNYHIGTWDIDLCMNVRSLGWKIATICDRRLIAINDVTRRDSRYLTEKVHNPTRIDGIELFISKWGFSSEIPPHLPGVVKQARNYDTAIITRAIYTTMGRVSDVGVLDEERLDLMQRYFINSLRNQTDLDFTLYVAVGTPDNETTARIKDLDWGDLNIKFIYTDGDLSAWKKSASVSKNWGREMDNGCPEDVLRRYGHPLSTIMARMDIDDWVAPGWIAHMKHMAAIKLESHFLINYQVISQGPDGRLYRFHAPHNHGRTSPFIALVQKTDPRISLYDGSHLEMGKKFSKVYTVSPSYVFMVCHGGNRSNRIYPGDRCFGKFENSRRGLQIQVVEETLKTKSTKVVPIKQIKQPRKAIGTDWRARIAQASFENQTKDM